MHILSFQRGENRSSRTGWTSAVWHFEADLSGGMQKEQLRTLRATSVNETLLWASRKKENARNKK